MDSTVLTGNPDGPHQKSVRSSWRRGVGWTTVREYVGTKRTLQAFVPVWTADAETVDITGEGPSAEAVVVWAQDAEGNPSPANTPTEGSEIETEWQLDGNDIVKDLYEHPSVLALGKSVIEEIKKQVLSAEAGTGYNTISAAAAPWVSLLVNGQKQFATVQWTLRRTVSVSKNANYPASLIGVDRLWDFEDLPTIPTSVLFDLNQIEEPNVPTPSVEVGAYRWAWLKKPPKVLRTSAGRFQIVDEWVLDVWSVKSPTTAGLAQIPGIYKIFFPPANAEPYAGYNDA